MAKDGEKNLNDPPKDKWDPLFKSNPIHGILKVAGESPETIQKKLDEVKGILGYPHVIADIPAQSPPANVDSRLDGRLRPREKGLQGHEQ